MNTIRRTGAGFTLLEILVAFVLLAVLGSLLLQLFQGGMRNLESARQITHAALLARSKLNQLQIDNRLQPGQSSGQFKGNYQWHLTLTDYSQHQHQAVADTPIRLLHASLAITWAPRGTYRINTLLMVQQP